MSQLPTPNSPLTWKQAWSNIFFRIQFLVTVCVIISFIFIFPWFFDFLEARNGPQLNDALLRVFPAAEISWIVFFFLYTGVGIALYGLVKYPVQMLLALQTYALVTLLRMLSITLFPLNPPEGYLPLHEPIAQLFVNDHRIISKDLFFSGHMASICALFFPLQNKRLRYAVLICVIGVGITVLIHRVHYTIDVLFAPIAAYSCYYVSKRFIARFNF